MLYRPTPRALPRQRLSPPALTATGALHVALLWLLLQYAPVQQAVRYVVYQAVRPAPVPPAAASNSNSTAPARSRAIPLPATRGTPGDDQSLFTLRPESSLPVQATDTLPELAPPKPQKTRRPRREAPRP